jgi:hypothetical protein
MEVYNKQMGRQFNDDSNRPISEIIHSKQPKPSEDSTISASIATPAIKKVFPYEHQLNGAMDIAKDGAVIAEPKDDKIKKLLGLDRIIGTSVILKCFLYYICNVWKNFTILEWI